MQQNYETPSNLQLHLLENTTTSESESTPKVNQETTGPKYIEFTDKSRKGDIMEHHVITEAMKRGAEVFKNVGCSGKIDIIIKYNDQVLECDVKSLRKAGNGIYTWCGSSGSCHAIPISVHPLTMDIGWHPKRVPDGFENFWN